MCVCVCVFVSFFSRNAICYNNTNDCKVAQSSIFLSPNLSQPPKEFIQIYNLNTSNERTININRYEISLTKKGENIFIRIKE